MNELDGPGISYRHALFEAVEEIRELKEEIAKSADQLARVRDWMEIPEETEAGINGVIDHLNEMARKRKL